MSQYVIKGVNGPVVTVVGGQGLAMMDMVTWVMRVSSARW